MQFVHYTEEQIREHAVRGSEISKAHGFEPATQENFASKCMLVITELHEGYQAVYDETPDDPLEVELADTAIRLQQILHDLWYGEYYIRNSTPSPDRFRELATYETLIWAVIGPVCLAVEAWRKGRNDDVRTAIELAHANLVRLCYQMGINLHAAVEAKLQKNAARPHLHGKTQTV